MGKRVCPICREENVKIIKKINMKIPREYHLPENYNVVACCSCGFVYADTSATLEDYDWYYTHCNFYGDDTKDDNSTRYDIVSGFIQNYFHKESVLLDIGAGNGRFEVALHRNGYLNITGVDPSEESILRLKREGISAYRGDIYSEVPLEEQNKYDGIFLFEVAEHLLLPDCGIENVNKMLKKDGIFIISVPDYSQISEEKRDIPNYFNLEHINYFSEDSLDNLMGKHGLSRINQKRDGIDLIHCYKKLEQPREIRKDVKTEKAVRKYFVSQEGAWEKKCQIIGELKETQREIVIWGTGSYLMSLIANTDLLECNLLGFVDNNSIKQGREMYGYQIYSPSFLQKQSCTVLICSMLNGNEIEKQLQGMGTNNDYIII